MMDLFDTPIWRQSDPATSKAAGQLKNADSSRALDRDRLLALIRAKPGHTGLEYAQLLIDGGMPWFRAYQLANKRVSDLSRLGLIVSAGMLKCSVSGRWARVWRAA